MTRKISQLEMIGISKSFHTVPANRDIHLSIQSGEILGLLGENGAGKTTLMNILYGLYQPDSGTIQIDGEAVAIQSPQESKNLGIGMVHQHFMLVKSHTVMENIILGLEKTPFFFPEKKLKDDVIRFSKRFNFNVDFNKYIWQLSAGEQQRVEIIKAMFNGADLLILDEPTSVLTPQEIRDLFVILKQMRDEGHMIILISHKLDEIKELCDRVTVLRKGKIVGGAITADTDKKSLARMMIGREILFNIKREPISPGAATLTVKSLHVNNDKGTPAVRNVSFEIRKNEILGIAGVSGNGQKELAEAISGMRKVETGTVAVDGKDVTGMSPRAIYNRGLSHVPEERIKFGIAPGLRLYENAILKQHHLGRFKHKVLLAYKSIKRHTAELVLSFNVHTPSIRVETKDLSGGNIQKLILGREIEGNPSVLIASHPTYGLDIGATEFLRKQLLELRRNGGAILLISEDLEEIFEVCDRVAVMFNGEFMGILDANDVRVSDIGLMMAGSLRL